MKRNYFQIFAVSIAFTGGAILTALVLAIPAIEQALGLSAWAKNGYEGGLAYLLIAAFSGLVVDALRFAAEPRLTGTPTR
jgi:hypothetical protein